MNPRASDVMALFPVHGPLTAPKVADLLDCSDSHAGLLLRGLHDEGQLSRVQVKSGGIGRPSWEYTPKEPGK